MNPSSKAFKLLCIMVFSANPTSRSVQAKKSQLRVINGQPDTNQEFNFAVVLLIKLLQIYARTCSGSLISDVWVITAAHCIVPIPSHVIGYGNLTVPQKPGAISKILKNIPHPAYGATTIIDKREQGAENMAYLNKHLLKRSVMINDIGLLLIEKVEVKTFAKISAVDYSSLSGHSAKYAGFGFSDMIVNKYTVNGKPLQVGKGVIGECPKGLQVSPIICLYSKCDNNQLAYIGDSGGPLVYDGKLVGVNSMILPGGYASTAVSPYISWIQDTMKET